MRTKRNFWVHETVITWLMWAETGSPVPPPTTESQFCYTDFRIPHPAANTDVDVSASRSAGSPVLRLPSLGYSVTEGHWTVLQPKFSLGGSCLESQDSGGWGRIALISRPACVEQWDPILNTSKNWKTAAAAFYPVTPTFLSHSWPPELYLRRISLPPLPTWLKVYRAKAGLFLSNLGWLWTQRFCLSLLNAAIIKRHHRT